MKNKPDMYHELGLHIGADSSRPPTNVDNRKAVIALVTREHDGRILVVWNRRYQCWALPGGKVEANESLGEALMREVREECGVHTLQAKTCFAEWSTIDSEEPMFVTMFITEIEGEPHKCELDCPVMWMSRDTLLRVSVFAPFYEKAFRA